MLNSVVGALGCAGELSTGDDSIALLPTPARTPMPTAAPPSRGQTPTPTPLPTVEQAPEPSTATCTPTSTVEPPTRKRTPTLTPLPTVERAPEPSAATRTPTSTVEPPTRKQTPTLTPLPNVEPPMSTPTPKLTLTPTIERPTSTPTPILASFAELNDPHGPCYPYRALHEYAETFHQWSPDGSRILFNEGAYVYAVDAAGSQMERVADTSGDFEFPGAALGHLGTMTYFDVSPDGSKLVYSTCRYGTPEDIEYQFFGEARAWVLDRLVYSLSGDAVEQVFIPFRVAELRRHSFDVAVSEIDGTEPKRLTANQTFDNYPVWSSDGTRIAFISNRSDQEYRSEPLALYTMASDGSDMRLLVSRRTVARHPPAWSPDGKRIAFAAYDNRGVLGVYTVRPDGSNQRQISETLSAPAWSPDGRHLALVAPDGNGATLYTFGPSGSNPVSVIKVLDNVPEEVRVWYKGRDSIYEEFWVGSVSWSPDGSEILVGPYVVSLDNPEPMRLLEPALVLLKSEGGTSSPELSLHHIRTSWSPDGSTIAMRVASGVPHVIDRDGTGFRALVR